MKQRRTVEKIYVTLSSIYPTYAESDDDWMTNGLSDSPFRSIVSVALSTMTSSPRCIKAAVALYEKIDSFEELAALDDEELRQTIRPVAHYNRKTKTLKQMSRQIIEEHNSQVPTTRHELMALPGIGRKCTDILLNTLQGQPTIAVDTHVKRLIQRLGLVDASLSAEKAVDPLTQITPERYRRHAHEWLIQHGMHVCVARTPKCAECPLTAHCDYFRDHQHTPAINPTTTPPA